MINKKVEVYEYEKEAYQFLDAVMVWFDLVTQNLTADVTTEEKQEMQEVLELEWTNKRDKFGLINPIEIKTWKQLTEYLNNENTDELFNDYGYHGTCCAFAIMAEKCANN